MISLVDTHTHLFDEAFDEDRNETYLRAVEAGVTRLYLPNIDDTTIDNLLAFTEKHERCYPLIGLHPTSVDEDWQCRMDKVHASLREKECYAGIGEVGMDLYWDKTFQKEQQTVLDTQIQWALDYDLPIIIHCRNAHKEMLEVFSHYKDTELRGIFHSFAGTQDEAGELLEYKNFMLGVNGIVTFKKSSLPEVLTHLPLDRVVLETDSPYLAPVPFRGKRNESSYVVKVAEKLSSVYNLPLEEVGRITTANALRVFNK